MVVVVGGTVVVMLGVVPLVGVLFKSTFAHSDASEMPPALHELHCSLEYTLPV